MESSVTWQSLWRLRNHRKLKLKAVHNNKLFITKKIYVKKIPSRWHCGQNLVSLTFAWLIFLTMCQQNVNCDWLTLNRFLRTEKMLSDCLNTNLGLWQVGSWVSRSLFDACFAVICKILRNLFARGFYRLDIHNFMIFSLIFWNVCGFLFTLAYGKSFVCKSSSGKNSWNSHQNLQPFNVIVLCSNLPFDEIKAQNVAKKKKTQKTWATEVVGNLNL